MNPGTKTKVLDAGEIAEALVKLPGWKLDASGEGGAAGGGDTGVNALAKTYVFGNFREALSFMVRAGFEAEALDHHPEWTNVYNKVVIRLTTHSAGNRVTTKDVELAARMEKASGSAGGTAKA